ncbi:MAG: fused MFS/spermidine synthase [Pigmentiphaga sp.]|uniref:spermidine synthase n=1 Tax=Pigmentiphaga sp. TaxID=1977564 RepID=UPI0029A42122|nr:fused MFS/spermidine synthase [Pigmentiphaga sp.]MDX3904518.1 fused MFS/spermidine synthase [Pigmentiphaga sp.]
MFMRRWRLRARAGLLALAAISLPVSAQTVIHQEKSAFEDIVVYESEGERCMKFGSVHAPGRQSCQSPRQPQVLLFDYTRMMMASLYLRPDPRRILVIGLGGGSLPMALAAAVPAAQIDVVEIDPAVARVAQRFFGFKTGPSMRLHVADGREFVRDVARRDDRYDIVMLDAFDETYIPRHLSTLEFIREVRGILQPGGVLAANTFSSSGSYASESAAYAEVFGDFYNLRRANRVILATAGPLPDRQAIAAQARALHPALGPMGIDHERLLPMFSTRRDWPADARPLHD